MRLRKGAMPGAIANATRQIAFSVTAARRASDHDCSAQQRSFLIEICRVEPGAILEPVEIVERHAPLLEGDEALFA